MTLTELSRTLPHGFHDAQLHSMSVDYISRQAELHFGIFVGLAPLTAEGDNTFRIIYQRACVKLSGVQYLIAGPPQDAYDPDSAPMVTSEGEGPLTDSAKLPDLEQASAFRYWFWVSQWQSPVYVAATDARLEWEPAPMAVV